MKKRRAFVRIAVAACMAACLASCAEEPGKPKPVSQPIVLGITPARASNTAEAPVVITGEEFLPGAAAFIGSRTLSSTTVISGGEIHAVMPTKVYPGVYPVRVRNKDGGVGELPGAFLVTGPGMIHSGEIAESEVWSAADSPHQVSGQVLVRGPGRPTLTIEPGCRILFQSGARLVAGEGAPGKIVADGGAPGIEFTTTAPEGTDRRGSWGLVAVFGDSSAVFRNCAFCFGGGPSLGSLPRCLLLLRDASAVIEDCLFEGSAAYGLIVEDGSRLLSFERSTLRSCDGPLLSVTPGQSADLAAGHVLEDGTIEIREGAMDRDLTWPGFDAVYQIGFHAVVTGVLTLEPGAELAFGSAAGLEIGTALPGGIRAEAPAEAPIVFRSSQASPLPGAWEGLRLGPQLDAGSRLVGVEIRHAGGSGQAAAILCDGGAPVIQRTRVTGSATLGILYRGGALPVSFARNEVSNCGSYGIELPAAGVSRIQATNVFAGNAYAGILVDGGTVAQSGAWSSFSFFSPYVIRGDIDVRGAAGPILTIAPGSLLHFSAGAEFRVGTVAGTGESGALVIEAGGVPTVASSMPRGGDPREPGDWKGIRFLDTSDDGVSRLEGCIVEYGGASGGGNVRCDDASPRLQDVVLQWSAGYGLYLAGTSQPDTSGVQYRSNRLGNVGP
jgi:hypothetical protein